MLSHLDVKVRFDHVVAQNLLAGKRAFISRTQFQIQKWQFKDLSLLMSIMPFKAEMFALSSLNFISENKSFSWQSSIM